MNVSENAASWRVEHFGREREPVVVIDGFSGCIDRIEATGRQARYEPVQGYPGVRSAFDPNYFALQGELLGRLFAEHFGLEKRFSAESCALSMVSLHPEALSQQQRRPHYDGTRPNLLATVHFTQGPETGGTAFYRHRRTGFETVTPERADEYEAAVREDEREYGPLPPEYYYGDSERYELIGEVEARPDRLIAYRGRRLHSGVIPTAPDPATLRRSGRLTVNAFLIGEM